MYESPNLSRKWVLPFGLGTTNCGPISCIDEVLVVYVFTNLFKKSFQEVKILMR